MLFLVFQLDQDRYALAAHEVTEVLPLVSLVPIPQAPAAVAGIFNYRGAPVPAVDLSQLLRGRPARARLNTRIFVVNYPDDRGAARQLGLIVERATGIIRREPGDFADPGVSVPHGSSVAADADGLTQWLAVRQLLPATLQALLFQQPVAG